MINLIKKLTLFLPLSKIVFSFRFVESNSVYKPIDVPRFPRILMKDKSCYLFSHKIESSMYLARLHQIEDNLWTYVGLFPQNTTFLNMNYNII